MYFRDDVVEEKTDSVEKHFSNELFGLRRRAFSRDDNDTKSSCEFDYW